MSYQVLARKWRPKSFGTLVGQEHVVRALSHALATGRLHHAWLFTGTRGVGKTTISRILAKALNCETGVTAEPCGECAACRAIDADRFPDYVEMDAASNRGVDDMAALLDKAVYAPTQGRYKVYMIDEVHMLTGHAFNAMLKTLEEPPEHVKFILATTDPQKIPVTVLSRCLQFNLKQMPPGHIVDHLTRILQAEAVPFEAPALRHLAKAASGSMRDALSLLDQAIAHGAGKVEEEQVTHMLGTVGDDHLYAVFDALHANDVEALLAVADNMATRSLSFDAALQALSALLHRVAVLQFAPGAIADEAERARLQPYADAFDAEYLQLAYQIAIHGRDELALAPDEQAGFTMTLLRLFAFRPEMPAPLGGPLGGGGGGASRARALPAGEA
ncbi:DNA polymerase III subunit gamma/tau, partial [Pseudothauera nasutitermitis]